MLLYRRQKITQVPGLWSLAPKIQERKTGEGGECSGEQIRVNTKNIQSSQSMLTFSSGPNCPRPLGKDASWDGI